MTKTVSKCALLTRGGLMAFVTLLSLIPGVAIGQAPVSHRVSGAPYTVGPACHSQGLDGEVSLAVDRRSGRMVAAWMQDVQGLGDPGGLPLSSTVVVTASSPDGVTWTRSAAPPGVMLCDLPSGPNDAVFDPSVSVGPDGRWYLARLGEVGIPGAPPPPGGEVYLSTSMKR